jgi:4-hydroxybenzoate polyprenyltransferase
MSSDPAPRTREQSWLWNHIGRLVGGLLLLIAIVFIALLAIAGFRPAEGLLVFLIVVFIMIAVGGRLHGL